MDKFEEQFNKKFTEIQDNIQNVENEKIEKEMSQFPKTMDFLMKSLLENPSLSTSCIFKERKFLTKSSENRMENKMNRIIKQNGIKTFSVDVEDSYNSLRICLRKKVYYFP